LSDAFFHARNKSLTLDLKLDLLYAFSLGQYTVFSSVYKQLLNEAFVTSRINNQGRGMGYQPKPKAEANNPHSDLDYYGYHKPESDNCAIIH